MPFTALAATMASAYLMHVCAAVSAVTHGTSDRYPLAWYHVALDPQVVW